MPPASPRSSWPSPRPWRQFYTKAERPSRFLQIERSDRRAQVVVDGAPQADGAGLVEGIAAFHPIALLMQGFDVGGAAGVPDLTERIDDRSPTCYTVDGRDDVSGDLIEVGRLRHIGPSRIRPRSR